MQVQCRVCKKVVEVPYTAEQYTAWKDGKLIQDAMPNLTPGQREMLITGFCDPCFDKATRPEPMVCDVYVVFCTNGARLFCTTPKAAAEAAQGTGYIVKVHVDADVRDVEADWEYEAK